MKSCLALLIALPVQAQFRAAPVRAPVLTPTLSAPILAAPTLTPSLSPALALPPAASPALPSTLPALAMPSGLPTVAATPAAAMGTAKAFASPVGAFSAVKEAAPKPGAPFGDTAQAAAKLDTLFDGSGRRQAGKLAASLEAPPAVGAVDLSNVPTAATPRVKGLKKAKARMSEDLERVVKYQEMLFARGERAVLLVFQGMDTGGKDGVIKTVVGAMNPQGVRVTSFKKPTAEEAKQHYLKRLEAALPQKGGVGVFNRSQYEDILVPTVFETLPPEEIELRYEELNRWEKELTDRGVVILKFFLHISKDEQKRRLQDRLDNPDKNWKFSPADLEMRKKWEKFQDAYGRIMARTSTPWAPWYMIPADNKWYRDYAVARIVRKTLQRLKLSYPPGPKDPKSIVIE
ncbi:MAG: polyphosphate kinase 2 family protein [Elusimicrobia bacterium]|nr:polyphosphate kinase 2 family protein [Elusimicrobiota bacterium]